MMQQPKSRFPRPDDHEVKILSDHKCPSNKCYDQLPGFPTSTLLANLIHDSPDFVTRFGRLTTNADRVTFCLNHSLIRNTLNNYITQNTGHVFESALNCGCCCGIRKHQSMALLLRDLGNELFDSGRHLDSWLTYSQALVFSDDENAALCYSNRSAVYFILGQYENSLADIEAALALDYTKNKVKNIFNYYSKL